MPDSRTKLDLDLEFVIEPHFQQSALTTFFQAMQEGYALTREKGTIPELPGSKTIEFLHGDWRVLDTYIVSPQSPYSGGTTMMWYGEIPIWMMQYVGYYDDDAIPCLRAALRTNYEQSIFNGGRGPDFFEHEGFHYINAAMSNNFFGRTNGQEAIFDSEKKIRGIHLYQAWWMVSGS